MNLRIFNYDLNEKRTNKIGQGMIDVMPLMPQKLKTNWVGKPTKILPAAY